MNQSQTGGCFRVDYDSLFITVALLYCIEPRGKTTREVQWEFSELNKIKLTYLISFFIFYFIFR